MSVEELESLNPAAMYERPFDVLRDMTLSRAEKIELLHRWLSDALCGDAGERIERGSKSDLICAVTKALQFLGAPTEIV